MIEKRFNIDFDLLETYPYANIHSLNRKFSNYQINPFFNLYKQHLDHFNSPVIMIARDNYILHANQKFVQLFGRLQQGNYTQKPVFLKDIMSDKTYLDIVEKLHSQEQGFTWSGVINSFDSRGKRIKLSLKIIPIFLSKDNKKPDLYLAIYDNISVLNQIFLLKSVTGLLEASRIRDNDTGNHVFRINEYAKIITEKIYKNIKLRNYYKIDLDFMEKIGLFACLHDVGKIGTPDDILNKQGPLEEWEWDIMKEHTINGAFILNALKENLAKDIALHHHEKWDGSGYPYGLKEEMIPISARIVAIADVYDALRMKRTYKKAFDIDKTCKIINEGSGKHFDPFLVDVFNQSRDEFHGIFEKNLHVSANIMLPGLL